MLKSGLIKSNNELFQKLIKQGFLLLNATLVLQDQSPQKDAKAWYPFIKEVMNFIKVNRPNVKIILFGLIANKIDKLIDNDQFKMFYAEHPYNHSFVTNCKVLDFFRPFHLLKKMTNRTN